MSGIVAPAGQVRNYTGVGVVETTFADTSVAFAATDSFQILGAPSFNFTEERSNRRDVSQGRSYYERVIGRRVNDMTFNSYVLPPGGATVPDVGFLMQAACGTQTIGGSSVTYSLADTLPSVAMSFVSPGVHGWQIFGAVVQEMVLTLPENDNPTVGFTLNASNAVYTGRNSVSGAVDGTGTPVTAVTPSSALAGKTLYDPGSRITIGTSTGHRVTAVDQTTGALSITPSVTTDEGTDPAIIPYTPFAEASLAAANVVGITQGQVDWAGTSDVCIKAAEFRIANNFSPITCFGSENVVDYSVGRRDVSGFVTVWARTTDLLRAHIGRARAVADRQQPFTLILGRNDTVGSPICTIAMPNCEFDFPTYEMVEDGVNSIQVPFVGQGTGLTSGNNEISFVFASQT